MISDKLGQELHDRSTRRKRLTDKEQAQLESWYEYHDNLECEILGVMADNVVDENQTPKEWEPVTFKYSEDEISVSVPNVYAWVNPLDGDISFTPDTVDELITTVRELIETAKRAQQRRPLFTEYVVSVGLPVPA